MAHPFLNCEKCEPNAKTECNYPNNGVCIREAKLPPAVCPMFDVPLDECPGIDFHLVGVNTPGVLP